MTLISKLKNGLIITNKIEDSYITDYFQGQTVTELKCSNWGYWSYSFDNSMFLHLEISNTSNQTMDEIIENMSKPEKIDDFKWSKWKKQAIHSKSSYIYKSPKILIIHLKRFEFGAYSAKKITTNIELDNNLDLQCK